MSGKLIVFEGVEGCGKTTQLQRCQEWLVGQDSPEWFQRFAISLVVTREPGGTQLGCELRQLLCEDNKALSDSAELLLYAADRAQHVKEVLKPQLASGAIILCDRYTDSTIAYQGYGRGLSLSLIDQLNSIATGGLESNLTLWLDVDVEVGLARTKNRGRLDRIEQANLEFHQRVQWGYTELAKAYPQRIVQVDSSGSVENVQQQIRLVLSQHFSQWYPD